MAEHATVVLVHGAWHGAWCWDEVAEPPERRRRSPVVAVDLPSVASGGDLYDDARAVREVLADDGRATTVVVGHSYGGIVITEGAAGAEGVRHLALPHGLHARRGRIARDHHRPHAARLADRRRRRARR